jgi:hypothetical protein
MTTIKGRLNIFASYKLSVSNLVEISFGYFYLPETTHNAYSGKKEQRLATSCFYAFL